MGANTAPQRPVAVPGETLLFAVSFDGVLDSGELLTGAPTVVEQTTSDLTFANETVSTAALTINHQTVAIGKAVQFKVIGHLVANSPYTLAITCSTDSTPAQTKIAYAVFSVETQ